MLGNDCKKLMNVLMNSQICTHGSVLRQAMFSDPNNISKQFHRCAIKVQIPLLCQSESHRRSSPQQHGSSVPDGGHIHFPVCLMFPQGKRDSHGIDHPSPRAVKPRAFQTQILGPLSATVKAFWFLTPRQTHKALCSSKPCYNTHLSRR